MNPQAKSSTTQHVPLFAAVVMLAIVFILGCSQKQAAAPAQTPQTTFNTPAEAGHALQAAARAKDEAALARILGPKAKTLVSSGDPAEDAAATESFTKKYDRMNRWVPMTDGSQVLYIGADNYPFPIAVAKDSSSKWSFSAASGDEELRARRIGRNELLAMDACRLIADAEELYYQGAHDGSSAHRYTDTIISTPGRQDGLYWEVAADQAPSPLGKLNELAKGIFASGAPGKTLESNGYSFRILAAQGEPAKEGARKQATGFEIIASPIKYQDSGVMTFILSREGALYQHDLGAETADLARSIREYTPADAWTQAE